MRRHSYTITELLTVIAIIAILAAIAIPSVGYARKRARTTACISNQGQTMKTILNSMADTNNRLYSGTGLGAVKNDGTLTSNAAWSQYLADKGYIKNTEALRCPDISGYTTDEKVFSAKSTEDVYGVVVAKENSGKFDFRGTKLFRKSDKTEIAPSVLAIGACATTDGKTPYALLNLGENIEKVDGKPTGVHSNDSVNMFFYDGHAENFNENTYKENKYFPQQTSETAGNAVAIGSVWQKAVK